MNQDRPNNAGPGGQMPQGYPPQGYAPQGQQGGAYAPQGGYPPQGYAPQGQQGYPQQQYPGQMPAYQPQQGYPQNQPVNPPQGYAPGQAPQSYPQNQAPQGYPQGYAPGQVPQGYPQGYPQGQPSYGQMPQGFQQQPYPGYQQMPAGYPQGNFQGQMGGQAPQPKRGLAPEKIALYVLCALPLLFLLGLVMSNPVLKWIFIVLAVAAIVALWVRPIVQPNTRLTFTTVYAALAVVALVSVLTGTAPADTTNPGSTADPSSGAAISTGASNSGDTTLSGGDTSAADTGAAAPLITVTDEPTLESDAAVSQLKSFFYFWSVNKIDDMVGLCAPSWISGVEAPKTELFSIVANRLPTDYEVEKISGSASDSTRTATVTATIDRRNGRDPSKYRFAVIMLKENDVWYVDPRSLTSNEAVVTATPEDLATATPAVTVDPNTVLYYNPNGGTKYHLDANCKSANAKFLPFKGTFKYSQINDDPYKTLSYCSVCNAPSRP